ncbi:hypothetical protein WA026_021635 [Henosepilachna vigintioctopunctata]|uniref:Uncharacterized protein n=1 Tax=Henosepilachna vigintioctopunctata TaxID=420089 RepID=A0AAW1V4W6_9CUCU
MGINSESHTVQQDPKWLVRRKTLEKPGSPSPSASIRLAGPGMAEERSSMLLPCSEGLVSQRLGKENPEIKPSTVASDPERAAVKGTGDAGESLPTKVGCSTDSGGSKKPAKIGRKTRTKSARRKEKIQDGVEEELFYTPDKEVGRRGSCNMEDVLADLNTPMSLREERESLDRLTAQGERSVFLSRQNVESAPGTSTPFKDNLLESEEEDERGIFSFLLGTKKGEKRKRLDLSSISSEGSRVTRLLGAFTCAKSELEEIMQFPGMEESTKRRLGEICKTIESTIEEEQNDRASVNKREFGTQTEDEKFVRRQVRAAEVRALIKENMSEEELTRIVEMELAEGGIQRAGEGHSHYVTGAGRRHRDLGHS